MEDFFYKIFKFVFRIGDYEPTADDKARWEHEELEVRKRLLENQIKSQTLRKEIAELESKLEGKEETE